MTGRESRRPGRRSAIGLDVGGTKVAGLLVSATGEVLARRVAETPAEDVEAMMETAYRMTDELGAAGDAEAVGVGAAGLVDAGAGVMRFAPNLAWRDLAIRDLVAERTGLPTIVDNDANTAGWGEFRFGAGAGRQEVLTVTVGTGIGGAIISGGRLYRGAHGFAAEIGHVIVEPGGPRCGCGNLGCWEQVASGRALGRLGREAVEVGRAEEIARRAAGKTVTGRHVADAAADGDEVARRIVERVGRRLGEGIAGLVNTLDPEAVVVGGGVAEIGPMLLEPAWNAFVDALEATEDRPEVPLLPGSLGNDAGAIGAAALALEDR